MIIDIYVLDRNLDIIGIIDGYRSLIWANRYNTVGDCELYVPATADNLVLLQRGNYLARSDDEMICEIKKIQLDTDSENGNYLIVSGFDVKQILDSRIVWGTQTADGNAEDFIRTLIDNSLGVGAEPQRKALKPSGEQLLYVGTSAGLTDVLTEQISYKNLGEKIREWCLKFGWGYRIIRQGGAFYFEIYKGADRHDTVIFSDRYENLSTSTYIEDATNIGNVALIAGEGQGADRQTAVAGEYQGTDRYEVYVDARDISKTITYEELTNAYPGGTIFNSAYIMSLFDIQIMNNAQLLWLQGRYPGGDIITIDGVEYYRIYNEAIATLPSDTPEYTDSVKLKDVIYNSYLLTRGYDTLSEYGFVTSFEGTINPNTTFVFKRDYNLGDLVTVQNEYGITKQARIIEVIEVFDANGYSVEPTFKYIEEA